MKITFNAGIANTHAARGIGTYSQMLAKYLPKVDKVNKYFFSPTRTLLVGSDLVHFPSFDLFFLNLPLRKTSKWIVTIHDVIPLVFPDQFPPGIRGNLKFLIQKWNLHRAEAIITDSQASKKDIMKYLNIPIQKISVIYLGVEASFKPVSESAKREIRKKYALPENYILYVGDVNYNKNLPTLLEAFSWLPPNASLVLVSKAWKKTIPEVISLNKLIDKLGIAARIIKISNLPQDSTTDLVKLYNAAQVYIQPSLYEGFGLPVLEAMACGTPVVAPKVSSLPEVCGQAAIMVKPDAVEIAAGLRQVLSMNPRQRHSLIKAGFTQASKFTWEKTARETTEVYNKVLGNKN